MCLASSVTVRGVKVYISHNLVNRLFVYSHSVRVQYSGKKIILLNVGLRDVTSSNVVTLGINI